MQQAQATDESRLIKIVDKNGKGLLHLHQRFQEISLKSGFMQSAQLQADYFLIGRGWRS